MTLSMIHDAEEGEGEGAAAGQMDLLISDSGVSACLYVGWVWGVGGGLVALVSDTWGQSVCVWGGGWGGCCWLR
jgi:hypothetical protein